MIYRILKTLMRLSVNFFYRKIEISNSHLTKINTPVLIAANHPSTFMDPIIIAVNLKRKVYFLAKASVFNSSFSKWLLPKFNMIPVYRQQDNPELVHKNKETFIKCYEHLAQNHGVLIFPEGSSITERKLRKIKTGAARIALGAEAENNFTLGLSILPVGINYSDAHRFRSKVFINIHEPIHLKNYRDKYYEDAANCARELTEELKNALEKHIIAIEEDKLDELIKNIEIIYKRKISKELNINTKNEAENFELTKNLINAVKYFNETDPQKIETVKNKIDFYLNNVNRIGISEHLIHHPEENESYFMGNFKILLGLLFGLPLFAYGFIINIIPFRIPFIAVKLFVKEDQYRGAVGMVTGTFSFLLFYTIAAIFIQSTFNNYLITTICLLSFPFAGLFSFTYHLMFLKLKSKLKLTSLFFSKQTMIANLILLRKEIIEDLDKAKAEYQSRVEKTNF